MAIVVSDQQVGMHWYNFSCCCYAESMLANVINNVLPFFCKVTLDFLKYMHMLLSHQKHTVENGHWNLTKKKKKNLLPKWKIVFAL